MKTVKIVGTSLTEDQLKHGGDKQKLVTTKEFIEVCLDMIPQGGYTPKDIRDRNRIQSVLGECKTENLELEDADFENLKTVVANSRWGTRGKDISDFISQFD